jgi:hypothetical protein
MFRADEVAGCPDPERVDPARAIVRFAGRGLRFVPDFFDFAVVVKFTFMRVSSWSANAMAGIASSSEPASRPPMIFRVMLPPCCLVEEGRLSPAPETGRDRKRICSPSK